MKRFLLLLLLCAPIAHAEDSWLDNSWEKVDTQFDPPGFDAEDPTDKQYPSPTDTQEIDNEDEKQTPQSNLLSGDSPGVSGDNGTSETGQNCLGICSQ